MTLKLKKYTYYIFIFIILSSASLWAVQHFFNLEVSFEKMTLGLVMTLVTMCLIYVLLDGLRFYWILKIMAIEMPFFEIVKLVVIGTSVSNITPFLAGGSLAQIYLLNKQGATIGNATAATSIRAFLASTYFFTVLPIAFYRNADVLGEQFNEIASYLPILTFIYLFWMIIVIVFSFRPDPLLRLISKFSSKWQHQSRAERFNRELISFFQGMKVFLTSGLGNILGGLLTTSLHFTFIFFFSSAILYHLGYVLNPLKVAAYQMMANFVMYFGFTPGATGFAEGAYAFIFSKVVSHEDLALVVFLWRTSTVYAVTIIGFIVLVYEVYRHRIRS